MKKRDIIKKSNDYTKIIKSNNKRKNKYYSIFYCKSDKLLFGISIPTKTGNAVLRNKIKRQIKAIIDKNIKNIKNNYNYVIIVKKELTNLSFLEKEKEIMDLFKLIGEKDEK